MSVETNLQKNCQLNILLEENKNYNKLSSGKMSSSTSEQTHNFFTDNIDKRLRGVQNCHNTEDILSIPYFHQDSVCILQLFTFEHISTPI